MAKLKRVRDMVRVETFGDEGQFICSPPRELSPAQQEEIKNKVVILRMLNEYAKVPEVGMRHMRNIYYIELEGEPNAG